MPSPLKTYPLVTNPDGTHSIQGVEIFRLGKHRDFDYDAPWFERARANFQADRDKGYLPPVIVGHNDWNEKPAVAFADNLRLSESETDTILVDYLLASAGDGLLKLFKAYPQRSVELISDEARFTAVAQLGGSEPYHKFAPLNPVPLQFKAQIEPPAGKREIIAFESAADITIAGEAAAETIRRELSDLEWTLWNALWKVRDDAEMTTDEKKAKLDQLIEEWAGLYAEKEKALLDAEAGATETTSADFSAPAPVATQLAVSPPSPREQELQTELAKLRKQQLSADFAALTKAGLAVPIVQRLQAMAESLLPSPSVHGGIQGGLPSVHFTNEKGQQCDQPLAVALTEFCSFLTNRLNEHKTLFTVPGDPLPVNDTTKPDEDLAKRTKSKKRDKVLNFEADEAVKAAMLADDKPFEKHPQLYATYYARLKSEGKIQTE